MNTKNIILGIYYQNTSRIVLSAINEQKLMTAKYEGIKTFKAIGVLSTDGY